jgi:hypothetical protein
MYLVCTGTYAVFETVWGDFRQLRRLQRGRILPANRQTSVGRRLVRVASVMVPEWKCSVECDLGEYVLIQHWYIRVCTGINKAFLKIWKQTFFFTLNYGRWYLECGTWIWWYPSMIIVPHSPYNVHVGQLVYPCMNWVCTSTYWYVPCSLIYLWDCLFVSYDCRKRYCVCVTCMLWCSNNE